MVDSQRLLECDFSTTYRSTGSGVRNCRFSVQKGEIFGVAGESGSGKSTVALSVSVLAADRGATTTGSILFRGKELLRLPEGELRRIRGREIGWVSQSSGSALNPALSIGAHFREAWRAHRRDSEWQPSAEQLLQSLRISPTDKFFSLFPRELSVGMAQRVVVALGMLHNPALLIADEPTSALDLATQNDLLDLFRRKRADKGMSVLFVSHDLLALMAVCDRIAVLRCGEVVEIVPGRTFLTSARHPYTIELASSLRALLPSEMSLSAGPGSEMEQHLQSPRKTK